MQNIKKVAVIGTGVIGAGWIIRCLAHSKIVYAFDKDIKLKKNLLSEIKRTWPFVKKLFNKIQKNPKRFISKNYLSKNKYRAISDFISGMTDRYAINLQKNLK